VTDPAPPGVLVEECRVFSRYLVGIEPTPYVIATYARGHRQLPANLVPPDALDQRLLGFARRSASHARLADSYARWTRPAGILRQKLVLQLAVLEVSPPAHAWVNDAVEGRLPIVVVKVGWAVGLSILHLAAGALIFGPAHLLEILRSRAVTR
jgi:hypothetical protein